MWLTRKLAALTSFDRKPKKQESEKQSITTTRTTEQSIKDQKHQQQSLPSFKSKETKESTKVISKTLPTTTTFVTTSETTTTALVTPTTTSTPTVALINTNPVTKDVPTLPQPSDDQSLASNGKEQEPLSPHDTTTVIPPEQQQNTASISTALDNNRKREVISSITDKASSKSTTKTKESKLSLTKKESKKSKEKKSNSSSSKEAKEAKKASKKEAKKEKKEKKESSSTKKTKELLSKKKKEKSILNGNNNDMNDDIDKASTKTTDTTKTTMTIKESKSKTVLTQLKKIKSSSKDKDKSNNEEDAKSTKSSKSSKSLSRSIRTLGSLRGSLRSKKSSIKSNNSVNTSTPTPALCATVDPITKPLPPIEPELPTHQVCDKTMVVVISGTLNIGKSTLIRLGLKNLTADPNNATPWQCHKTMFTLDDIHYPMNIIEIDDTMINTNQDPPEFPEDLGNVHGGLICYDTTNRDSMDCLPDLLNAYVSRNIPSYLVGLKADLSSLRQVDLELGKKLGNLFCVDLFEVDAFSDDGIKQMKDIYTMLVKQCIQDHGDEFQCYHTITTVPPSQQSDNESTITMRERRISNSEANSLKSRRSTDGLSEYSVNSNNTGTIEYENHSRRASYSSETNSVTSDYRFPSLSSKKAAAAQDASDAESSKPLTGFVYAPTSNAKATTATALASANVTSTAVNGNDTTSTTTTNSNIGSPATTAMKKKSSTKKHQQVNNDIASVQIIERKNSLHNSPYAKKGLAVSRRGSKDSCESMGTGLTIDDLIDKLLVEDPSRSDEHAATIFITFFRRFMKPGDLTRILIDRFDSDGLLEPPPTRIQERIQAIFLIWLTSYWNDFHSRRTRKLMIRFLERISKEDVLRPISASLLPLANRMAPDEDPDCHWGMADDDNEGLSEEEEEDYNNALESSDDDDDVFEECEGASMDEMSTGDDYEMTTTPTLPATKNKKDSGYSSESFVNYFPSTYDNTGKKDEDSKSISEGCIPSYSNNKKESEPALKRTASVSSFSLFGTRQRQSSITSSLGFLFSFAPMTAAKPADSDKNEEEEQQQQQQQPEKEDAKQDLPKKNKLEPSKEKQQHQQETSSPPHPTPPPKEKLKSVVTPVSQQQQQQQKQKQKRPSIDVQSITTTNTTTSINKQPPTTNVNKSNSNRTEFSGGLIDIDINCSMSASPSWTSFGATTISSSAASFISVFGAGGNNNASGFRSNNNNNNHHNDKSEKEQVNYSYKVMMEIPERAIADQLTWIESELFGKIKAREFVRNIWCPRPSSVSSEDQLNKCHSAVAASIAHFNFISAWVATIIVTQPKLNKRAGLLEKFMSIAVELRNHNNYNSLMAILAGLNSASVLRLKQTREAISDKKLFKQFKSLERLMSSDRSFSSYRLALKASEAPGIPYLGIHNQDLVSLAEGNKDLRPDGTIHWEKFRLMGECIVAMMKFQCPAYDIEPDGKILHFIADTEILSEDEQYKRSNLIEPRLKSSSTNRLRDLWLRM